MSYGLQTLKKQLSDVQTAIARIETTGQAGRVGDLEYTEANLSSLYRREEMLLKRIARFEGRRPQIKQVRLG